MLGGGRSRSALAPRRDAFRAECLEFFILDPPVGIDELQKPHTERNRLVALITFLQILQSWICAPKAGNELLLPGPAIKDRDAQSASTWKAGQPDGLTQNGLPHLPKTIDRQMNCLRLLNICVVIEGM